MLVTSFSDFALLVIADAVPALPPAAVLLLGALLAVLGIRAARRPRR